MPVRYHDETQEIIEWYKNECSVDGEGLDDDNAPSTQQSEHSTGIESVVGLNHDQHHPDQNYGDGGYSIAEQQKFYSHGRAKSQNAILLANTRVKYSLRTASVRQSGVSTIDRQPVP